MNKTNGIIHLSLLGTILLADIIRRIFWKEILGTLIDEFFFYFAWGAFLFVIPALFIVTIVILIKRNDDSGWCVLNKALLMMDLPIGFYTMVLYVSNF